MKRKYLIAVTYAAPQNVIKNGEEAVRLHGYFEWVAVSREVARVWAMGLRSCIDLIEIDSITEVGTL